MGDGVSGLRGRIEFIENLGDVQMTYLACDGLQDSLRVKSANAGAPLTIGQEVVCDIDWNRVIFLDSDGALLT
jgi:hypothetical protein